MSLQQPPGPPAFQPLYQPPTSGKATTSLVLGIVSLVACGLLLGIPAMIVGRQAKREIRESGGRLSGDGLATAGIVTGLIGTLWSILALVLVVLVFAFGAALFKECHTVDNPDGSSTVVCHHASR
jgi:hypothetical protein